MSKLNQYIEALEINTMDPIRVMNNYMDPAYDMAEYVLGNLYDMYDADSIRSDLEATIRMVPSALLKAVCQVVYNTRRVYSSNWTFFSPRTPTFNAIDRLFEIERTDEWRPETIIVKSKYNIANIKHPWMWEITEIDAEKAKKMIKDRKEVIKRSYRRR